MSNFPGGTLVDQKILFPPLPTTVIAPIRPGVVPPAPKPGPKPAPKPSPKPAPKPSPAPSPSPGSNNVNDNWPDAQKIYNSSRNSGKSHQDAVKAVQQKYKGVGPDNQKMLQDEYQKTLPASKPTPAPKPVPAPKPTPAPKPASGQIIVNPSGNVGDLRYPKTLPALPSTATPPAGAVVGERLSQFSYSQSSVNPKGAAKDINVINQVAPAIFMNGLRFRGKWNDGDRNLTTGSYSYKARAEMSLGKDPYKLGSTYLIGSTVLLAPDFQPSQMYTNIYQPIHFQSYLTISGSGDNLTGSLYAFTNGLGTPAKLVRSFKFPRNQWVSIVMKIKLAKDGYYGLSINGDQFQGIKLDTTTGKAGSGGKTGKPKEFGGPMGLYMTNKGMKTDAVVFHAYPFYKKIA